MANYLWYSEATDVTGKKLAEALNIEGILEKPQELNPNDIIIGWGAKTSSSTNSENATILNHPNDIRKNRNKFNTLKTLFNDDQLKKNIALFCSADEIKLKLQNNDIRLPIIGRTNFHQAGKGFWLCLTHHHVEKAIQAGAQYFQEYIAIKNEYRIHIAFGKIIYAVKKIENTNIEHWKNQRKEKIALYAEKNNLELDENSIEKVLSVLVKETTLPDQIIKSNTRGWKFSHVPINRLNRDLKEIALNAVKTIKFQFGAVDCAIDENNNPFIIEINSGPGLKGTPFSKYVGAFQEKLQSLEGNQGAQNIRQNEVENNPVENNPVEDNPNAMVRMMRAVRNEEDALNVLNLMRASNG